MKQRAIFFDRDGTLIVDKDYLTDPELVEFMPGAVEALKLARNLGFLLFVVTNQSAIARGMSTEEQVRAVNSRVIALLQRQGVELDGLEFCPHHPDFDIDCNCRKPKRGMIDRFLETHDIDLERSYVIGDTASDIDLGLNIGATSILLLSGYGESYREDIAARDADIPIVDDVLAAVKWIAGHE